MSTLSSANVTDVNLVLKKRTHKIKIKYSMHQYSNSYAYFRQLPIKVQTSCKLWLHWESGMVLSVSRGTTRVAKTPQLSTEWIFCRKKWLCWDVGPVWCIRISVLWASNMHPAASFEAMTRVRPILPSGTRYRPIPPASVRYRYRKKCFDTSTDTAHV